METPASLSNSAAAAMIIQRAFRDAQKRIAADHVDLTAILNSLEEAEEHRINARTGVMTRVEKNLESSGAGFGIGSMIRSLADKSRAKAKEQQREARTGEHLPTLTSGSMDNLVTGLGNGERVAQVDALTILGAATVMLMDEPSVCDITVPPKGKCIVVGDLHGQLVSALQHSTIQPSTDPRPPPVTGRPAAPVQDLRAAEREDDVDLQRRPRGPRRPRVRDRPPHLRPVSYTHLTLPTKRIV